MSPVFLITNDADLLALLEKEGDRRLAGVSVPEKKPVKNGPSVCSPTQPSTLHNQIPTYPSKGRYVPLMVAWEPIPRQVPIVNIILKPVILSIKMAEQSFDTCV